MSIGYYTENLRENIDHGSEFLSNRPTLPLLVGRNDTHFSPIPFWSTRGIVIGLCTVKLLLKRGHSNQRFVLCLTQVIVPLQCLKNQTNIASTLAILTVCRSIKILWILWLPLELKATRATFLDGVFIEFYIDVNCFTVMIFTPDK